MKGEKISGDSVFTFHWDKTKEDIRKYWWLILLPLASVIGQIVFVDYAMPTFNEHVMTRVGPMLHMGSIIHPYSAAINTRFWGRAGISWLRTRKTIDYNKSENRYYFSFIIIRGWLIFPLVRRE